MNFGQRFKDQISRLASAFRGRKFKIPFQTDSAAFRERFQGINWKKFFDFKGWKIDRARLNNWRANWRTNLANLPSTLAQLPARLPQDFRLSRSAIIYINCAAVVVCAYFAADLAATIATPFLPEPPARQVLIKRKKPVEISRYDVILQRNIFDAIVQDTGADPNGPPVKTSLPIALIGLILLPYNHKNPNSIY